MCTMEDRCDVCRSWTDDFMNAYVKHQRCLDLRRQAKNSRKDNQKSDACTGTVGSESPAEVVETEGSVYSSVSGVSSHNFESLVDRRLQEHDSKLDTKFEYFAGLIRNEMRSLIAESSRVPVSKPSRVDVVDVPNQPLSAPREAPLQPDPAVLSSNPLGNPQSAVGHKEVDPWGRVLPVSLACPSPRIVTRDVTSSVGNSDQLVAALGGAGVSISRSIADRIMGMSGSNSTSVGGIHQVGGTQGVSRPQGAVGARVGGQITQKDLELSLNKAFSVNVDEERVVPRGEAGGRGLVGGIQGDTSTPQHVSSSSAHAHTLAPCSLSSGVSQGSMTRVSTSLAVGGAPLSFAGQAVLPAFIGPRASDTGLPLTVSSRVDGIAQSQVASTGQSVLPTLSGSRVLDTGLPLGDSSRVDGIEQSQVASCGQTGLPTLLGSRVLDTGLPSGVSSRVDGTAQSQVNSTGQAVLPSLLGSRVMDTGLPLGSSSRVDDILPALERILGGDFSQIASSSTALGAPFSSANAHDNSVLGSGVAQGVFSSDLNVQGLNKPSALGASATVSHGAPSSHGPLLAQGTGLADVSQGVGGSTSQPTTSQGAFLGHRFPKPDLPFFESTTKRKFKDLNDDDDDTVSEGGSSISIFRKLFYMVTSFFPGAKPKDDRPPPARCVHEPMLEEIPERPSPSRFTLYDRVSRIREDVSKRFNSFIKEGRKMTRLLRTKRGAYRVADDPSFATPPVLGEDFKRLCTSGVSTKGNVSVPLEDLVKVEAALSAQQEMQSFALWIISTVFAQVSRMELDPEEVELFKGFSSSLCLSMVHQTTTSHNLSAFLVNLRRSHYAKFLHPAVLEGQKKTLLSSPVFSPDLFDQALVAQVHQQLQGDAVTSSNLSVTSWFAKEVMRKQSLAPQSMASRAPKAPLPGSPLVPPVSASAPKTYVRPKPKGRGGGWYNRGRGKVSYRGKASRGGYSPAASKQQGLPK